MAIHERVIARHVKVPLVLDRVVPFADAWRLILIHEAYRIKFGRRFRSGEKWGPRTRKVQQNLYDWARFCVTSFKAVHLGKPPLDL